MSAFPLPTDALAQMKTIWPTPEEIASLNAARLAEAGLTAEDWQELLREKEEPIWRRLP